MMKAYNTSVTVMSFVPVGKTEVISAEYVDFNGSLTLSEIYRSLGKATDQLSKEYRKSGDDDLKQFAKRYAIMADEANRLSRTIRNDLAEYNKEILTSTALILDD